MVYAATVGTRRLTFYVSGWLWRRSLVMRDKETGSWWSHILGRAMDGELEGKTLAIVPAEMVTWEDWRARHPETTVLNLPRTARNYTRSFYARPAEFVYGLVHGGQSVAYPFDVLGAKRVIEDVVGDEATPVLVTFDPKSTRGTVFDRRLDGKSLSFTWDPETGTLGDASGSTWDPARGVATAGKHAGRRLAMLPAIISYARVWRTFHPESRFVR